MSMVGDWGPIAPVKNVGKQGNKQAAKKRPPQGGVKVPSVPSRQPSAPATQGASASTASAGANLGSYGGTGQLTGLASGGFGGGGGGGGAVAVSPEPALSKKEKEAAWLEGDDIYQTALAGGQSTLDSANARLGYFDDGKWKAGSEQRAYDTDFNRNLQSLGWITGDEWNPDTYMDNRGVQGAGSWNKDDKLTSYGSSFSNQLDDFAARGMLDSSAYMQALNNLNRGFGDQLGDLVSGRSGFITDLQGQSKDANNAFNDMKAQARNEALQRMAAEAMLGGL